MDIKFAVPEGWRKMESRLNSIMAGRALEALVASFPMTRPTLPEFYHVPEVHKHAVAVVAQIEVGARPLCIAYAMMTPTGPAQSARRQWVCAEVKTLSYREDPLVETEAREAVSQLMIRPALAGRPKDPALMEALVQMLMAEYGEEPEEAEEPEEPEEPEEAGGDPGEEPDEDDS